MTLVVAAAALPQIGRAGYSTDEELTIVAVRGIREHGLPLLPSNLLYDRGLGYSYASWLAGEAFGHTLASYRAVALASALGALTVLFALVRALAGAPAALLAITLVAMSLPFWAVATTARFYAPFLLLYLLSLRILGTRFRTTEFGPRAPQALAILGLLAFAARLTHELAFSLAAIPAAIAVVGYARGRVSRLRDLDPWLASTAAIAAGLVAAQLVIVGVHYLAPQDGGTMIRRFFLWQLLNLFGSPLEALDFLWHIFRTMPLLVTSAVLLAGARAVGVGGRWSGPERFVHVLWIGWVIFFGVIDSGITINYLLVPVTLMLVAIAMDLAAIVPRRWLPAIGVTTIALLALEQWRSPAQAYARLDAVRPTIAVPDPRGLRARALEAPMVACTDELACLLLAGRVDVWLALDEFVRERFVVVRDGRDEGVYAGSPAVSSLAALFEPREGRDAPGRVLVIDVFKDLPVGPSSRFLDRALEAEPVASRVLVETPRLRVLEITPGSP